MIFYIAGPMTGYPDHNADAFRDARDALRAAGHTAIVPSEENGVDTSTLKTWTWSDYLRADLVLVCRSDALALLPGWEASRGACLEVSVAHALGMNTYPIDIAVRLPTQ